PNAFGVNSQAASLNCAALLITGRINDVEHHGEKEIADQDCERGVHYRLSGGSTDANCSFACGQSFLAADEHDEYAEAKRLGQTHDDIAAARPTHHVRHIIGAVNIEHENRYEITGCGAHSDALRHQKWHRNHHGQDPRHYQVINRVN